MLLMPIEAFTLFIFLLEDGFIFQKYRYSYFFNPSNTMHGKNEDLSENVILQTNFKSTYIF